MKIQIIILNIVIVIFLVVSVLFPVFFLDRDFMGGFWKTVWPLELVIVLALAGMNIFFLKNRRMFALLEKEDWPALAAYLEKKIFQEKRFTVRQVKLLAQTYLVSGNFDGTARLESIVNVDDNALIFGAARVLGCNKPGADTSQTAEFFRQLLTPEHIRNLRPDDAEWLRWYYGFSLILNKAIKQAEEVFSGLASDAKNPLICGLSAWFLSQVLRDDSAAGSAPDNECLIQADEAKARLRLSLKNADKWNRKADKIKNEVHGIIIKNYLDEAGAWLFKDENNERN